MNFSQVKIKISVFAHSNLFLCNQIAWDTPKRQQRQKQKSPSTAFTIDGPVGDTSGQITLDV
jgi:hypothetical protein